MEATANKKYKIIIADDDDDDQFLIKLALRDTVDVQSVTTVNNGLELVELLFAPPEERTEAEIPDFILLDLNMPILDGYGVLEKLNGAANTRAIPVYVLTTSRFEHDRRRSIEMGAAGFYSKPYQYEELKTIIRSICAARPGN